MSGSKVRGNNLGEGLGCQGNVQGLPGNLCKGCRGNVQRLPGQCGDKVNSFSVQLKVELGLQVVREEFDKKKVMCDLAQ